MIGLTYVDRLSLRWYQWGVLLVFSVFPSRWGSYCVLLAFLGEQIGTDTRLLFQECQYLQRFSWRQFLSEVSHRNYVGLQNPFFVFAVSRFPVFLVWQVVFFLLSRHITATPLSLLMMTQPSPDLLSYLLIQASWPVVQKTSLTRMFLYGAACIIKSSALVLLPILVFRDVWIVGSLGMVAVFWFWFSRHHAGRRQIAFLTHLGYIRHPNRKPFRYKITRRWSRYKGRDVLTGIVFYLCPAYLSFSWQQWTIVGMLLFLAPNAKYFLLSLKS